MLLKLDFLHCYSTRKKYRISETFNNFVKGNSHIIFEGLPSPLKIFAPLSNFKPQGFPPVLVLVDPVSKFEYAHGHKIVEHARNILKSLYQVRKKNMWICIWL